MKESESVKERIAEVRVIPIELPVRRQWRWRGLFQELGRWVLVRVESEGGAVGWGEATPLADWGGDFGRYYGETPTTVSHLITQYLAPAIQGVDVWETGEIQRRMTDRVRGHPYAKAAVDIALWDLRGHLSGQPLYRLLGGSVRRRVGIAQMVGLMPAADASEEARGAAGEGIRTFQIKVSGDPDQDTKIVSAVRAAVGGSAILRVDVNQGYRALPLKQAIQCIERLAAAGANIVEQPVEGLVPLAAVRAAVNVTIMADESCWNTNDLIEIDKARAADAISIYLAKAGGLGEARRVADLAEKLGMQCDVNGSLESGIGTLASLHVAAACSAISLDSVICCPAPSGFDEIQYAGRYFSDDVLCRPVRFEDGALWVPDEPGLGIEVDEAKVRELSTDRRGVVERVL